MEAFTEIKLVTERLFEKERVEEHPLFQKLESQHFSEEQIHVIALQLYHVVETFPRFLAAIATNIPNYKMRMPLVENLFEEHGRMNDKLVHSETYKLFLKGLGITDKQMKQSEAIVAVIAYNRAIIDLCLHHYYLEGLAALGVIEEIVARVSPIVNRIATTLYGGEKKTVVHFADHEVLDVAHANEIYEVAALAYTADTKKQVHLGLELGMYYHTKLYDDILKYVETELQ